MQVVLLHKICNYDMTDVKDKVKMSTFMIKKVISDLLKNIYISMNSFRGTQYPLKNSEDFFF